jgi:hypothetical protein
LVEKLFRARQVFFIQSYNLLYFLIQRTGNENTQSRNMPAARAPLLGKGKKTKDEKTLKFSIKEQTANESIVTNVKKPLYTSTPADVLHHVEERKPSTGQKTER